MTEIVFAFPLPQNRNSTDRHWRRVRQDRDNYFELLDYFVTLKRLPEPPPRPWVRIAGTVEVHTFRLMDKDNANTRMKLVWDWMERRRYLVNDRIANLELTPRAVARRDTKILLRLTEVADGHEGGSAVAGAGDRRQAGSDGTGGAGPGPARGAGGVAQTETGGAGADPLSDRIILVDPIQATAPLCALLIAKGKRGRLVPVRHAGGGWVEFDGLAGVLVQVPTTKRRRDETG